MSSEVYIQRVHVIYFSAGVALPCPSTDWSLLAFLHLFLLFPVPDSLSEFSCLRHVLSLSLPFPFPVLQLARRPEPRRLSARSWRSCPECRSQGSARSRWQLPWGACLPGAACGSRFAQVISRCPFLSIGYLPAPSLTGPHFSDWRRRRASQS